MRYRLFTCVAAGEAYSDAGKKGFVCAGRLLQVNDEFHGGCIGYHLRAGLHYFSREDRLKAVKFIKKHIAD